ncbi:MAG: hypothetical protein ACOYOP_09070 [Microthrixaceae bacterium]
MAAGLLAAAVAIPAACTPSSTDSSTQSSSDLGIEVAAARRSWWSPWRTTTTVPTTTLPTTTVAPTTTAAPTTTVPVTASPTQPPLAVLDDTPPAGSYVTPGSRLGVAGCPLFPRDNVFHASIRSLPVKPGSANTIAAAGGAAMTLNPGFSSGVWMGSRGGYPVNVVDSRTTPRVGFLIGTYSYLSDNVGVPMPANPLVEGAPGLAWDRHLLVVDSATCSSYEAWFTSPPYSQYNWGGTWTAETLVRMDLNTNQPRRLGSTMAAGTSMLHGLVRYDEVATGDIDHALHLSLPSISSAPPVWPAMRTDGRDPNPANAPMGSWFRLRADADLSGLGPQALTVARALQTHGAILDDTGHNGATIVGEPDDRWNDLDLAGLRRFNLTHFEIVDPSAMVVDPTTHQIR